MKNQSVIRLWASCGAALTLSFAAAASFGADNRFEPRLEIGGKYDSNIWLLPDSSAQSGSVSGGLLDASAVMSSTTQRARFSLTPRVHATHYTSDSDKNSTDLYLSAASNYQALRSNYAFGVDAAREGVTSSELVQPGDGTSLGTTNGGESGIIIGRNTVETLAAQGSGSWTVSERSLINAAAGYSHADYDHRFAAAQNDYSNVIGSLGWTYQFSQRIEITPSITASEFRPESGLGGARSIGAQVEMWRKQTQQLRAFLRLGANRSVIDSPTSPTGEITKTTPVLGAGVERALQRGQLFLQFTHMIDPNGSGFLLQRDDAYLRFTHNFSQRLSSVVGLRGVWATAVDKTVSYADRRYVTGSAGLEWRFRRNLSLLGQYGGANQHFSGGLESNSGNSVSLTLIYQANRAP